MKVFPDPRGQTLANNPPPQTNYSPLTRQNMSYFHTYTHTGLLQLTHTDDTPTGKYLPDPRITDKIKHKQGIN